MLLGKDFTTSVPRLYLEYISGGSLSDQESISSEECEQILRQLLSALAYLHGLNPPILHRDIKPDNILVHYRHAGDIHVKFGDFGVSGEKRESGNWRTICGTWKYSAPEMLEERKYLKCGGRRQKRYTAAVDIWSLGVVMFKLLCGLPQYHKRYKDEGTVWCELIIEKLEDELRTRPDELIQFLSTTMLIIKPDLRGSAQECYDGMLLLSGATEDGCQTPTPASCAAATPRDNGGQDPQTVLFHGAEMAAGANRAPNDSIDSAELERYIRSDNPPPPSRGKRVMRSGHGSVAAEFRGQEEVYDAEMEHCYQNVNLDPLRSPHFGSSLAALGPPPSWHQPLDSSLPWSQPGSPHLVAGGAGYAQDGYPIQGQAGGGRSWGKGGRSWGKGGRSWGNGGRSWNEGQVEDVCGEEERVASFPFAVSKGAPTEEGHQKHSTSHHSNCGFSPEKVHAQSPGAAGPAGPVSLSGPEQGLVRCRRKTRYMFRVLPIASVLTQL